MAEKPPPTRVSRGRQASSFLDPSREHRIPRPACWPGARVLLVAALVAASSTCSTSTAAEPDGARSILFVGNSLTYVNDLPAMVRQVAEAAGGSLRVGMAAGPNLAVVDHTNGVSDAVDQITRGRWDVVLLQQGPTPAGICRDTLIIAAMRLAPLIRSARGRPALFLPWARQSFPQSLDWAGESATAAARAAGGIVVPIGVAWRNALAADPGLPLYGGDGYHPAPAGTLLAALTTYDRVAGRDVSGIDPAALRPIGDTRLTSDQLRTLTAAAHAASAAQPPDPPTPEPADTVHASGGGGPC
jgi:hypothetical protein